MNTFIVWIAQFFVKPRRYWYREYYLKSRHWKARARKARRLADYRCEECGRSKPLDVHHVNYSRIFWEWNKDLKVLCRTCHKAAHER